MKLVIDTRNGIAGDIAAAGLIGLGADPAAVCGAMEAAGNLLGRATASHICAEGVHRISLSLEERPEHLHAAEARKLLAAAFRHSGARSPWADMGRRALESLISAEASVHATHPALREHFHGHEPVLHEASDIIVDIAGLVAGLEALDIRAVEYMGHVNVGGGKITFSHGTLDVPAPATRHILETQGIPWRNSVEGMEMATPTGAAILAGCGASKAVQVPTDARKALAGGTRPLPPIMFMLSGK